MSLNEAKLLRVLTLNHILTTTNFVIPEVLRTLFSSIKSYWEGKITKIFNLQLDFVIFFSIFFLRLQLDHFNMGHSVLTQPEVPR